MDWDIKGRIIKETFRLLAFKSCKNFTMDELSSNLGISKRTLYENFPDKATLIAECLDAFFNANRLDREKIWKETKNPIEAFLTVMLRASDVSNKLGISTLTDIKKYYPEIFYNTIQRHNEENKEFILANLRRTVKEGYIIKNIDLEFILNMIQLNMTQSTDNEYLTKNPQFSSNKLINAHIFIIFRGICTLKGLDVIDKHINEFL